VNDTKPLERSLRQRLDLFAMTHIAVLGQDLGTESNSGSLSLFETLLLNIGQYQTHAESCT
jgi:hypothetical protein